MLSPCLCRSEDTTLFGRPNHTSHLQSESFASSHDEARSLNSRLAKWVLLLSQYDMIFNLQKAVNGQALAEFLAAHLVPENSKLHEDIPDEVFESNVTSEGEV